MNTAVSSLTLTSASNPARRWLMQPALPLILLCFAVYAYFYQGGAWNQNVRFDLVRSLVEQHTSVIDTYVDNTGDLSCLGPQGRCLKENPSVGNHAYCDKAPGTSWLALPVYAALWAKSGGGQGGAMPPGSFFAVAAYLCSLFASGLPAALGVGLLAWLLRSLEVGPKSATVFALAYGLATMLFPYATVLFGHALAASLAVAGYALLARLRHGAAMSRSIEAWCLFAAGLALGYAVIVEYPCAIIAVVFFVYALSFVRPFSRLGWLILGGAGPAIALALYNGVVFGSPLALPYDFSTQPDRGQGVFMGIGALDLHALSNILFTGYRGLFFSQPWLLLAIPGLVVMARRPKLRADAIACAVIFFLFVWMNASMVDWPAGYGFGPRYLIPALPFLAVPAAAVSLIRLNARGLVIAARGAVLGLMLWSGYLMLVASAVGLDIPNSIERPFADFLFPQFYAGELAVNEQGVVAYDIDVPVGGHSAWNAGEQLFGLQGLASLLPLAVILAVGGGWLALTLNRRPPSGRAASRTGPAPAVS